MPQNPDIFTFVSFWKKVFVPVAVSNFFTIMLKRLLGQFDICTMMIFLKLNSSLDFEEIISVQ